MYKQLKETLTGINHYLRGIFIPDNEVDTEKDLIDVANKKKTTPKQTKT